MTEPTTEELAAFMERLIIMDEVQSNNPMGRLTAARLRELEAENARLLALIPVLR
jgi:hypothetical protein